MEYILKTTINHLKPHEPIRPPQRKEKLLLRAT